MWDAHRHDHPPRAARNRRIEAVICYALAGFYLWLGVQSRATGVRIGPGWLTWKAPLFGSIFAAAIMIDIRFKPVGDQLAAVLRDGSSDATEIPLRPTMDATRK